MFRKKTGVKIMAVILAAAIAMPPAGIALAAGREAVRQETEDSGGSWWDNLLHDLYAVSGREGEEKSKATSTSTNTNTNTNTSSRSLNYAVALQVAVSEGIVYGEGGEALKDKVTVKAHPLEGSDTTEADIVGFDGEKDCLLKYYDAQKVELPDAPKDAGSYFVRAYSYEESHYKSKGSEYVSFTIAPKPITIKPKDQNMELSEFTSGQFPEMWEAELAKDSELAYDEELAADYKAACAVKKGEETITVPEMGVYDLVITGQPKLSLKGDAKADNYEVTVSATAGKLTIGKKLELKIETNKKIVYGEFEQAKFAVTAAYGSEDVSLDEEGTLTFQYFDESGNEEIAEKDVRKAGAYKVAAKYEYVDAEGVPCWGESAKEAFEITKRSIAVNVEDFAIENGAALPDAEEMKKHLIIEGLVEKGEGSLGLPYDDEWEVEPTAKFEDENIDTTVAGNYVVLVEAKLKVDCENDYDLVVNNGAMTVGVAEGDEKTELQLQLGDMSVVYGEGGSKNPVDNIIDAVIKEIKATEKDGGKEVELLKDKDNYNFEFFDSEQKPLEASPVDVDEKGYYVKAAYKGDEAYKESEATDFAKLMITPRTITIEAESYGIANGAALPEELKLKPYDELSYEDQWAEDGKPEATYADKIDDTTKDGDYAIIVSAKVEAAKEKNYNLDLKNGTLSVAKHGENGKSLYEFDLKEEVPRKKIYDGKPFDYITKDNVKNSVVSKYVYAGEFELVWSLNDEVLTEAPKDAGIYTLTISIPETAETWEGSKDFAIEIEQKPVTATIKPGKNETPAGEPLKSSEYTIETTESFVDGDNWIKEPVLKIVEGDEKNVNTAGSSYRVQAAGGDAGSNYQVAYGEPVVINVSSVKKSLIGENDVTVTIPRKGYTYTGEQICPTVTVKYNGKSKLKLNADYVVDYSNNVNAGNAAAVTVRGIGEYAGYVTKTFAIQQKNMKGVTLSEVGAVKMGDDLVENLKKTLVVMDGNYEISSDDYEILVSTTRNGTLVNLSKGGTLTCGDNDFFDKAELKVQAKDGGNYTGISNKKAKLVIFGKDVQVTPITDVVFNDSCLTIPKKGYTYNGRAQKPRVKLSGSNAPKAAEFKAVYRNNVDAGEKTAEVRIVGVAKKKRDGSVSGYYGVSAPVTFSIAQKDIKSVKVSAGTAIPKNGSRDDIKLTVKDGKRVLTEGVDYRIEFINKSDILDENGQIKSNIQMGKAYEVKILALGGNYKNVKEKIKIKFGQLNLASKNANIKVSTTGGDAANVKVLYNEVELKQGVDYDVSRIRQNKDGTYAITIKAAKVSGKNCLYKGSRTEKKVAVTPTPTTGQ